MCVSTVPFRFSFWVNLCSCIRVSRGEIWGRRPWVSRFHWENTDWIFWTLSISDNSFSSCITSTSTWFSPSLSLSFILVDNGDDGDDGDDEVEYELHFIFASVMVSIIWVAWCESVCPAATNADNSLNCTESNKTE